MHRAEGRRDLGHPVVAWPRSGHLVPAGTRRRSLSSGASVTRRDQLSYAVEIADEGSSGNRLLRGNARRAATISAAMPTPRADAVPEPRQVGTEARPSRRCLLGHESDSAACSPRGTDRAAAAGLGLSVARGMRFAHPLGPERTVRLRRIVWVTAIRSRPAAGSLDRSDDPARRRAPGRDLTLSIRTFGAHQRRRASDEIGPVGAMWSRPYEMDALLPEGGAELAIGWPVGQACRRCERRRSSSSPHWPLIRLVAAAIGARGRRLPSSGALLARRASFSCGR